MNFFRDPDFLATIKSQPGRVAGGTAFLLGRSAFGVAVPWLLGRAADAVCDGAGWGAVLRWVGLLIGVSLVTAVCQYGMRWLLITASRDVEQRMRLSIYEHLLTLSWPFYNRSRTGDLMSRLTSDIESVRMGVGPGFMYLFDTALRTVGSLAFMAALSLKLTGAAIIPIAAMFLGLKKLLRDLHDLSLRVQEEQGEISTRVQESFSGARVIKAFGRERDEEERFRGTSDKYAALNVRLAKVRALLSCAIEMGGGAILTVVLLIGGWQVIDGSMTLGAFLSFIAYLQMLVWPMIAVGWVMSLWQRAQASESRLETLRGEKPEIVPVGTPVTIARARGDVELRNLTFRHATASEPVIRDVSIVIPAGTSLGIVGRTGSGKTTIANLIPRLLDPQPETVLVDGVDVRRWDLSALRAAIAIVPQETFLFSQTIEENVTFGVDDPDPVAIARCVHQSALDEAIATFPDGLKTLVGERGVTLSGGQRQRTAIARALAIDAPILILDDCLSAVDTETEARILGSLRDVMKARTTIVISHRLAAMAQMDQVIVLDEGRIVEKGTHDELLQGSGLYAELARLQELEAEMGAD